MTPQSHRRPTSAVEELEAAALTCLVSVLGSEARSMSGPSSMIPRRSRVLARSSVSMARGHYAWSAAMCGRKMNLPSPNPSLKATLFASISRQESDVSRERARADVDSRTGYRVDAQCDTMREQRVTAIDVELEQRVPQLVRPLRQLFGPSPVALPRLSASMSPR